VGGVLNLTATISRPSIVGFIGLGGVLLLTGMFRGTGKINADTSGPGTRAEGRIAVAAVLLAAALLMVHVEETRQ